MRKVLIISYNWPPSGGIGVLRNLKFTKYLRDYGWEPVLFVPTKANYSYLDQNNLKDIPAHLEIIRCPIAEPFSLFKLLSGKKKDYPLNNPVDVKDTKQNLIDKLGIWIRGNFFIPDARALWIRPATKQLLRYLKDHKIDAIFTDGPPHTNTRIGNIVARKTNIPWLADFQDPWTQVDYLKKYKLTKLAWKIHRDMEQEVFKTANKITSASPGFSKQLESIGAKDVSTLYYGYDEDDFKGLMKHPSRKFRISHAGLMGEDRLPRTLFRILEKLTEEIPEFAQDLEICFMGQVDHSVLNELEIRNLASYQNLTGTISRKNVLQEIMNSAVLLLCINKAYNANARIPAKIFEYIRTGNSILALGPPESDISDLLKSVKKPQAIAYTDENEIALFIRKEYSTFKANKKNSIIDVMPEIEELSNKKITQKLALLLDHIAVTG